MKAGKLCRQERSRTAVHCSSRQMCEGRKRRSNDDQSCSRPLCTVSSGQAARPRAALSHPHRINLSSAGASQPKPDTNINESVIVMRRHKGPRLPTRFVNLDRLPADDRQANEIHQALLKCQEGQMEDGWGVVSHWPAESIESGDWTPAIWRSPRLAKAGEAFARLPPSKALGQYQVAPLHDGSRRVRENFERSDQNNEESIPILESKGAEGQKTIKSTPDGHWIFKKGREQQARHYLEWSSHLLITAGQDNSTARLTATASETKYLGQTWFPVVGLSPDEAKAIAVFTNSTPGRLQIMRGPGKKLTFPSYSPQATNNLRIPDIKDERIRQILADCWERTMGHGGTAVPRRRVRGAPPLGRSGSRRHGLGRRRAGAPATPAPPGAPRPRLGIWTVRR